MTAVKPIHNPAEFSEEKYGAYEGERWTMWVRFDDGTLGDSDFYIVNNVTRNWKHYSSGFYTNFPCGYKFMMLWDNTHPDERRKLGWNYSWMDYADVVGQNEIHADPNHWF